MILDERDLTAMDKKAEAVSFVWDPSVGKVVFGMSVVLLVWTDGRREVPLGIKVWQKGGKSKVVLAEELLKQARDRCIGPDFVLFDS